MAAEEYMMPCLTKKYLGIDCLGCGTQRAFLMLMEGDFVGAFKMYPAIYTLILLVVFAGISILDKRRNYAFILIGLGIANALIMLISYFWKHSYFFM